MKSHKLAEWLLDKEDREVYILKDDNDNVLREFHSSRPLYINGIMESVELNKLYLTFRGEKTAEEKKEHGKKREELEKTHGLKAVSQKFDSNKLKAEAIIKEGKEKGFTLFPAVNPEKDNYGFIVFKHVDGIELAYNPEWEASEGEIDGFPMGEILNTVQMSPSEIQIKIKQ